MSLLTVLSLEPTTMREVRQRAPAHVIVRKAWTGDVLGTLKVFLPFTIRLDELAQKLGLPLQQHCAVLRGKRCTLDGLVLGRTLVEEGRIDLSLVLMPLVLPNARLGFPAHHCGLRRFYKEFRVFATTALFGKPEMPRVTCDGAVTRFCGVDLRTLAPLVLQFVADGFRWRYADTCPRRSRTRAGCDHAIVARTGAPHKLAHEFVDKFCQANPEVLQLLEGAIMKFPHSNYFS